MKFILNLLTIIIFGMIIPFAIGRAHRANFIDGDIFANNAVAILLLILSISFSTFLLFLIDVYIDNNKSEPTNDFKLYRKKALQPMRPYVVGEDLTGISVNKEDTPELGGMIARNPLNHEDQWYVAKKFFNDNYEQV